MLLASLASLALAQPQAPATPEWVALTPLELVSAGGASFTPQADGSLLVGGANPDTDTWTLSFTTELTRVTGLQLELLPHDATPTKKIGRAGGGNVVLNELRLRAGQRTGGVLRDVPLQNASASFSQANWAISGAIDGAPASGWAVHPQQGQAQHAYFETALDVTHDVGARLELSFDWLYGSGHVPGCVRVWATGSPRPLRAGAGEAEVRAMQAGINAAIDRGVEYLLQQQHLDGSFSDHLDGYRNGSTALAAYALYKSAVPASHPAIQRAVVFLRAREPQKTYSLGCQLLLLAALEDPEHLEWAEELTELMIDWERGGYGYPNGAKDLSCTQYGALGLWAASKLGIEVPLSTWGSIADQVVNWQPEVEGTYADAGFSYRGGNVTGSMTAAGVAVLQLAQDAVGGTRAWRAQHAQALRRGVRWLGTHFSAVSNPGNGDAWLYYYLYGLERAGALTDEVYFGSNHWYAEGARYLLQAQKGDGHWDHRGSRKNVSTAFALLFLTRATAGTPLSGLGDARSQSIYGEDDPEAPFNLRASGDSPLTVWVSTWGDATRSELAWEGEAEQGPRVRRIDYVTEGAAPLPDARQGGSEWRWTIREPRDDWMRPAFDDRSWREGVAGFGHLDYEGVIVRTEWDEERLWMRRELELASAPFEPELWLAFTDREPPEPLAGPGLVCLFDEDPEFVERLSTRQNGSTPSTFGEGAFEGERSLRVTPNQSFSQRMLGWNLPIRQSPERGEYRWIRFVWRKQGGNGIMLQLADNGGWGRDTVRYFSGRNAVNYQDSIQVDAALPGEWTIVERDLWEDFGRDANLTGLAFTAMNGQAAEFDGIYLARRRSDLRRLDRATDVRVLEEGDEPSSLRLWINGELAWEGGAGRAEYQRILHGPELAQRLRAGTNTLAVEANALGEWRALDLGLADQRLLASIPGDVRQPAGLQRFAARATLPRNGAWPVTARATLLLEDGAEHVLESPPLTVQVTQAPDPLLLRYASDAERDLLLEVRTEASASTQFNGWPATQAVDGLQARGWLCADGDPNPTLTLVPARALRANTILFSHPHLTDPQRTARALRLEVRLNGDREGILVDMNPDPMRKTELDLGKPTRIRRVEVLIRDRGGVQGAKDAVGFGEVELQLVR